MRSLTCCFCSGLTVETVWGDHPAGLLLPLFLRSVPAGQYPVAGNCK